jgi:hypothetical protein
MKLLETKRNVTYYCDFCGASDRERSLVDGKHAFICEGCVREAIALFARRGLRVVPTSRN